jgi:polyribonucleotide nucleotidyltransferase
MTDRNSGAEIGAIVELVPGKDGMVHISEFSNERIRAVSDVVQVGQTIKVKVMTVDKERGRIGLSVKALSETGERPPRPPRDGGRSFGNSGGHRGGPFRGHRPERRFDNDRGPAQPDRPNPGPRLDDLEL